VNADDILANVTRINLSTAEEAVIFIEKTKMDINTTMM
jgi:hypothetical protein